MHSTGHCAHAAVTLRPPHPPRSVAEPFLLDILHWFCTTICSAHTLDSLFGANSTHTVLDSALPRCQGSCPANLSAILQSGKITFTSPPATAACTAVSYETAECRLHVQEVLTLYPTADDEAPPRCRCCATCSCHCHCYSLRGPHGCSKSFGTCSSSCRGSQGRCRTACLGN